MTQNQAQLSIVIRADGTDAQGAVKNLSREFDGLKGKIDSAERSASAITGSLSRMGQAASAALAINVSAGGLIQAADAWKNINAQLKIASGSASAAADAYKDVLRIAVQTGQGLDEVNTVYRRLAENASALGVSGKQVASVTETISRSMAISGVSAESARAALTQFGQALSSGVLRGEEFNSVMEQAPRLARALADGLNVPIGQLRKLAEAGAITSDTIIQALESQNGRIADEFGKMPVTMGRAVTNLKTQFTDLVGSVEKNSGVFGGLASGVDALAKNLDTVAAAVGVVGAVMVGKAAAGLAGFVAGQIAAQAATQKLAAAELQAAEIEAARAASMIRSAAVYGTTAAQTEALTLATNRLNAAQAGAAAAGVGVGVAARAGSAAIGMLGGPIGIVTTLLTLGATAWMVWGDKAKNATKEAAKDAAENIDAILLKLGDLNGRIEETSRKSYDGTIKAAEAEIKPLQAKIADMKSQAAALETGLGKNVGQSKSYQDLQVSISALTKREIELQSELGLARSQSFAVGTAALNRFIDANAVGAEKVRVTQEKLSKEFAAAIANTGGVFDESNIQHQRALKALRAGLADAEKKDKKTEPGELKKIVENLQERLAVLNAQAGATEKLTQTEKEYQALLKSKPAIAGNATVKALADQAIAAEKLANATAVAKKEEEAYQKLKEQSISALASELKNVADQVDAQRKHNEEIGLTTEALAQLEQRRLDDAIATQEQAFAQAQKEGADLVELKLIDDKIAAMRELKSLKAEGAARQVVADEAKRASDDWKKFTDDIERSLTDSLMRSFESGENFGKTFVKSLQNTLKTTVLKVAVQGVVGNVMGAVGLGSGSSGSGSGMLSAGSSLANMEGGGSMAGSALLSAGASIGGLSGGFMTGAGAALTNGAGILGNLSAGSSLIGTGTAGGIATGAGMIAPYALAALAVADAVGLFGKRGGPQQGQYSQTTRDSFNVSHTSSGGAPLDSKALAAAVLGQVDMLYSMAGRQKANVMIDQGYGFDPQGTSQDMKYRKINIDGRQLTSFDDRSSRGDSAGAAAMLSHLTSREIEAIASAIDDSKLNGIIATLKANFGDLATAMEKYAVGQAKQQALLSLLQSDEDKQRDTANSLFAAVGGAFNSLNVTMPDSVAGLHAFVAGLDLTTKSGADTLATLDALGPSLVSYIEAAKKVEADRRSWQEKLDVLNGTTTEKELERSRTLASTSDTATQALMRQVWATQDIADAAQVAAQAQQAAAQVAAQAQQAAAQVAAQAQQAAAARMLEIDTKRRDLSIQLLEAQGKTVEAEAEKRKDVLSALSDASLQDLQQQVWAALDAAKAQEAARQAAEAAQQAAQEQARAAQQAAQEQARAAQQAAEEAARAQQQIRDGWQRTADSILETINRLRGDALGGTQSFAAAQSQFAIATAAARAGDQSAAAGLPALAQSVVELGKNFAASRIDQQLLTARTLASLTATVEGLKQFGISIPGFARGGDFSGGLRIVGENGPELEATGSARIYNFDQTRSLLQGGEMAAELRALRAELAALRAENSAENRAIAGATSRTAKVLERFDDGDAFSVRVVA